MIKINVLWSPNEHINVISEESGDTEDCNQIELILKYITIIKYIKIKIKMIKKNCNI